MDTFCAVPFSLNMELNIALNWAKFSEGMGIERSAKMGELINFCFQWMIQFPKLKEIFFTKLRDQRWFISDFPNNVPIRQKFSRNKPTLVS